MRERVRRIDGVHASAAPFPIGAPSPDYRRLTTGLVVASLCLLAVRTASAQQPPAAARSGWSHFVDINKPGDQARLFQAAFAAVTQGGVDADVAAAVLKEFGRRVDGEVAKGRSMTICYGLITDGIAAAYQAKWSVQDAAEFLIRLHKELDSAGGPSIARLRATVTKVREGGELPPSAGTE